MVLLGAPALGGAPRVLPPGRVPADTRLGPLRGERGDFSLVPARSPSQWRQRAERVRRIMRVALGLWPMPSRPPFGTVIHGKLDRGDYTVEKVYFESIPGLFVTGNLYRPKGKEGKSPGVLSPHGHFSGGRFQDAGRDSVRRQIIQGAERFEDGGRSFMQSRCVQLARMGCVVFHYDMVGYADSQQIPMDDVHRFSGARVKFRRAPAQGFYSASAELRLQNPMGLHTYNSIRALDFLISLPEVDPERIAVTGASGGGTQTFMLCAVDNRPLVSVPAVIVSTTRQGGCTCENISGLRIGTYNLEFTALHAPKPLLLISADDATRTMGERGFPELRQLYATLGVSEKVSHVALLHFPHNYNYVSRAAMYHWVNRHLGLGLEEPILERPYRRLTEEQLTVWDEDHPQPERGPDLERRLLDWLTKHAERQMAALFPRDRESLNRYREIVGGAWDVIIRHRVSDFATATAARPSQSPADDPTGDRSRAVKDRRLPVRLETTRSTERDRHNETLALLRYRSCENHQAELPLVVLSPKEAGPRAVIWIDTAGKSGLYDQNGLPKARIRRLLASGTTVVGADLLYQGEFLADGQPIARARSLPGEEAFAGWTYCYNLPLLARRVHDILAVVALLRDRGSQYRQIDLVGLGGAGPWVAIAVAQARGAVARAAVDTGGFRFAGLTDVYDVNFLPGSVKYNDLPGVLALAAPTPLWLAGEGNQPPPIVKAAYQAAGKPDDLTVFPGKARSLADTAVEWLLDR